MDDGYAPSLQALSTLKVYPVRVDRFSPITTNTNTVRQLPANLKGKKEMSNPKDKQNSEKQDSPKDKQVKPSDNVPERPKPNVTVAQKSANNPSEKSGNKNNG